MSPMAVHHIVHGHKEVVATFQFAGLDVKRKSRLQLARFGYVDPKVLYKMARDGTIENFEFPHPLGDEDFATDWTMTGICGTRRVRRNMMAGSGVKSWK